MLRKTPLRRKSPIKRYTHRPKVDDTRKGADFDRLVFIRQLPCAACNAPPPSHAHHFIGKLKGMALKAPDSETLPLCMRCHKNLHEKLDMFRVMDRPALKAWQAAKISHYQLLYQRHLAKKLDQALRASKLSRQVREQLDGNEEPAVELVTKTTLA